MSHAEAEIRRRGAVPDEIEAAGPQGEHAREEVGRLTYEINVQQYAHLRENNFAVLIAPPIIAYDGAEQPAYTMDHYRVDVPGCRTPSGAKTDLRCTTPWVRVCCGPIP